MFVDSTLYSPMQQELVAGLLTGGWVDWVGGPLEVLSTYGGDERSVGLPDGPVGVAWLCRQLGPDEVVELEAPAGAVYVYCDGATIAARDVPEYTYGWISAYRLD